MNHHLLFETISLIGNQKNTSNKDVKSGFTVSTLLPLRMKETKARGFIGISGVEGGDLKMTSEMFADPQTVNALIEIDISE